MSTKEIDPGLLAYLKRWPYGSPKFADSAVATQFGDLRPLTMLSRKLPLVSDQCVFYEKLGSDPDDIIIDSANYTGVHTITRNSIRFKTNDLQQVQEWYRTSSSMLSSGRIVYCPYIHNTGFSTEEDRDTGEYRHWDETKIILNPSHLFRAMPDHDVMVTDPTTVPLFTLQIPGLENITPSQLARLMDDYPDALLSFRNLLQRKLLTFDAVIGSNDFARQLRMIDLEIQDGLKKLTSDFRRLRRKSIIEAIGAEAVTWTLFVLVFLTSPSNLLSIVLPGGAIAAAAKAWAKYLDDRSSLQDNHLYFLFLVSNTKGDL